MPSHPTEAKVPLPAIALRRAYDPPAPFDGTRLLVDRLWPRGVSRAELHIDGWPKALTPSAALRRDFHAGLMAFDAFAAHYRRELAGEPAAVDGCLALCRAGPVTLVTAVRDPADSHAAILRDYLLARLSAKGTD